LDGGLAGSAEAARVEDAAVGAELVSLERLDADLVSMSLEERGFHD
jgi:hypothetical protein